MTENAVVPPSGNSWLDALGGLVNVVGQGLSTYSSFLDSEILRRVTLNQSTSTPAQAPTTPGPAGLTPNPQDLQKLIIFGGGAVLAVVAGVALIKAVS